MSLLCWAFGVRCFGSDGGSFLKRTDGIMYDLDLVKVNKSLVKALQLSGAVRRSLGRDAVEHSRILDLEREIREAAVECQRVLELIKADANRPLIGG